jgi:hypothetical protein
MQRALGEDREDEQISGSEGEMSFVVHGSSLSVT